MFAETDGWTLLAILALTVISVVTRSFFFISEREWQLPGWAQRGLPYAPIAALSAVIAPDILMFEGDFDNPLTNAHVWGALATVAFFVLRRHSGFVMVGAIAAGMAVFLPLRLLLNW